MNFRLSVMLGELLIGKPRIIIIDIIRSGVGPGRMGLEPGCFPVDYAPWRSLVPLAGSYEPAKLILFVLFPFADLPVI